MLGTVGLNKLLPIRIDALGSVQRSSLALHTIAQLLVIEMHKRVEQALSGPSQE